MTLTHTFYKNNRLYGLNAKGHRVKALWRKCEQCGNTFAAQETDVDRGFGIFCSIKCKDARRTLKDAEHILETQKIVDPVSQCWVWPHHKDIGGYGRLRVDGRKRAVHVLAALLWLNYQDGQGIVCHKCDNPPCFNPEHLFIGTNRINVDDSIEKKRHSSVLARNKRYCKHGHEFSEENTRWYHGHRICRACHANVERKRRVDHAKYRGWV